MTFARRGILGAALALLVRPGVAAGGSTAAAPLRLDPSFGAGGVVLSTSPLGGEVAVGYGIASAPGGRILAAGVLSDATGTFRLAVWRFAGDGTLDAGFGKDGIAVSRGPDWGWSLDVDPAGRILVAGIAGSDWRTSSGAVVGRFLPDGAPDPSFGEQGRLFVASPLGGAVADGSAVAADGLDGVLVAGAAQGPQGGSRAVLWRFGPTGRPDPGFGEKGALVLPQPEGTKEAGAWALRRQGLGWLAAGTLDWRTLALWKVSGAGKPADGFGRGGLATARGIGRSVAPEEDGSLLVGGFAYVYEGERVTEEQAQLARFTSTGSLDEGYGTGGTLTLSGGKWPHRESFAMARSAGGRSFLAGYAGDRGHVQAAVWDAGSGAGGPAVLVLPNAAGGDEDRIYGLALDDEGRLLAVGFSRGPDRRMRLALWRLK